MFSINKLKVSFLAVNSFISQTKFKFSKARCIWIRHIHLYFITYLFAFFPVKGLNPKVKVAVSMQQPTPFWCRTRSFPRICHVLKRPFCQNQRMKTLVPRSHNDVSVEMQSSKHSVEDIKDAGSAFQSQIVSKKKLYL